MASSNVDQIASWNNASELMNRYLPILIYIFGIVGNSLNVLVLSQRALRSNPSAVFFLASSIAALIVILSGLTSRMMSGWAVDLTLTIDWICKVRNVILYSARTVVMWMIVLATVNRWLSSSVNVHRRHMSTLKNIQRAMVAVLLGTCLINAPIIYCYEANQTGALRGCYGSTTACRLTTDLIYAFGTTLMPLLLMIVFGLLTIRNVRHVQHRVQNLANTVSTHENRKTPSSTGDQQQRKKTDRQLLKMLLVQVTLLFLLTCPHAALKVYSSFAPAVPPESLDDAIQNFILNLFTLFNFIASGMPFYVYTLCGGSVFRNALFDLVKAAGQKIFRL